MVGFFVFSELNKRKNPAKTSGGFLNFIAMKTNTNQ